MKKGINLLSKQLKYKKIGTIIVRLRVVLVVLTVFFALLFLSFSVILFRQSQEVNKLISNKRSLLEYLLVNKEVEAKFVFFNNRYQEIKEILKNDVNFLPFYSLLNESLNQASPAPQLKSLVINRDRTVSFALNFIDLPSLLTFLKFGESDNFLDNFDQLILGSFNIVQNSAKEKKANYELIFNGKFSSLK